MKTFIPFVSKLPFKSKSAWVAQIQKISKSENIILIDEKVSANLDPIELSKVEIAIVADPDLDFLKRLDSLKWVHTLSAGVENLIDFAKENNLQIVRMVDPNLSNTMAESVLTWTLYLSRKIPTYLEQQKDKHWKQQVYVPANQCKVGILGLGEMGLASGQKLLDNNFQVLGWSRSKKTIEGIAAFHGEEGLDEFVGQCDILVCLLPLTSKTQGIINQKLLSKLPKGASLINFSRGGMLKESDLIDKLDNGHLYHAVLDVFEKEPLPVDSALWLHEKITVLPHVAANTDLITAAEIVAKNIGNFRVSGLLESTVDLFKGY